MLPGRGLRPCGAGRRARRERGGHASGQLAHLGRYALPARAASGAPAGRLARPAHLARGPRGGARRDVRHRRARQPDRRRAPGLQGRQQPGRRSPLRPREAGRTRGRVVPGVLLGALRLQPLGGGHRERVHRAAGVRWADLPDRRRGLPAAAAGRSHRAAGRRIAAGDDFLVSPYNYVFVQNGFDGPAPRTGWRTSW